MADKEKKTTKVAVLRERVLQAVSEDAAATSTDTDSDTDTADVEQAALVLYVFDEEADGDRGLLGKTTQAVAVSVVVTETADGGKQASVARPVEFHRLWVRKKDLLRSQRFTHVMDPDHLDGATRVDVPSLQAATTLAKMQGDTTVDTAINARLGLANEKGLHGLEDKKGTRALKVQLTQFEKQQTEDGHTITKLVSANDNKDAKIRELAAAVAALKKINTSMTKSETKAADTVKKMKPELARLREGLQTGFNATCKKLAEDFAAVREKTPTAGSGGRDANEIAWLRQRLEKESDTRNEQTERREENAQEALLASLGIIRKRHVHGKK